MRCEGRKELKEARKASIIITPAKNDYRSNIS
jgi:hypothetical protein